MYKIVQIKLERVKRFKFDSHIAVRKKSKGVVKMQKEKYLSFLHSLVYCVLYAIGSVLVMDMIATVMIGGIFRFPDGEEFLVAVAEKEYLRLFIQDVMINNREIVSIYGISCFISTSILLIRYSASELTRSWKESIWNVVIYIIMLNMYICINMMFPITKITLGILALGVIIVWNYIHQDTIPVWNSMTLPPKYRKCSCLSLTILFILSIFMAIFISLIFNAILSGLVWLAEMIDLPAIAIFLFEKFRLPMQYIIALTVWKYMGELHDIVWVALKEKFN